jgi:hypothetical protein
VNRALTCLLLLTSFLTAAEPSPPLSRDELSAFNARLLAVTTNHLNQLMGDDGRVVALKGKSATSQTAAAYYHLYELTGNQKYRVAAVQLADRILADMKAMKFGVLYIKEKENPDGDKVAGGGPPAFGWYTTTLAHIYQKEGGRTNDLKYIATVLDQFPWNEKGWWSADIDVYTGISKQPLSKPSPINKNASLVLAAAVAADAVKSIDPALSARLRHKAETCLYQQIIVAQEPDGFWHYGLTGNDPKDKDVFGYFMVTLDALIQLRLFTDAARDPRFNAAFEKGLGFALKNLAPMTDPNQGVASRRWATVSTPVHYGPKDELKRGFQLGPLLLAAGEVRETMKIIGHWNKYYPTGNAGEDGAHAAHPSAIMLLLLEKQLGMPNP